MGRKATGLDLPNPNPWEAAMDQWWKAFRRRLRSRQEFMDRLMEQGKTYFATVERFTRDLTGMAKGSDGKAAAGMCSQDLRPDAGGLQRRLGRAGR
jgi:hypothetical protein